MRIDRDQAFDNRFLAAVEGGMLVIRVSSSPTGRDRRTVTGTAFFSAAKRLRAFLVIADSFLMHLEQVTEGDTNALQLAAGPGRVPHNA